MRLYAQARLTPKTDEMNMSSGKKTGLRIKSLILKYSPRSPLNLLPSRLNSASDPAKLGMPGYIRIPAPAMAKAQEHALNTSSAFRESFRTVARTNSSR